MRTSLLLLGAMVFVGAGLLTSVAVNAQDAQDAPDAKTKKAPFADIKFKGRIKFYQAFTRVFKISVDPRAMPLDSETMTAVMNGPTVAGAAAKEIFGLSIDDYEPFVKLKVKTSEKLGSIIAKVDLKLRADGRISTPAVNALADAIRKHLQIVLTESINIDRHSLEKRTDKLIARQTYLEKKYVEIWQNRVRTAEDAGLAESSVDNKRANIADMEISLRDVQLELELRRSRLESTNDEIKAAQSSSEPPEADPLEQELEKLVRNRARQLDAAENSDDAIRTTAEASMLEAKLRWIARVEELEKLKPESRAKVLTGEIRELETRQTFYEKSLASEIDRVRSLFRYDEHVKLLKKKEVRLDEAIGRIETEVDELANHSDKLGTITVTIIGQGKAK